jgi:hypothetical protein
MIEIFIRLFMTLLHYLPKLGYSIFTRENVGPYMVIWCIIFN